MSIDEFLTPEEVSKLLKVTRLTVYRWIKEGELKAVKAGRAVRVRREDLEAFLKDVEGEK